MSNPKKSENKYTFSVSTKDVKLTVVATENELEGEWKDLYEFAELRAMLERMTVRTVELKVVAERGYNVSDFPEFGYGQFFDVAPSHMIEASSHGGDIMTWHCVDPADSILKDDLLSRLVRGVLPGGEFRKGDDD